MRRAEGHAGGLRLLVHRIQPGRGGHLALRVVAGFQSTLLLLLLGRGEHHTLIDSVKAAGWEHVWQYRHPGPGRYRCEFRDARRQVVKVEYVNAMPREQGGRIVPTRGRYRPPKRTVPPPVDARDQQTPTVEQHRQATQAAARAAEQKRDLPRKVSEPRRYPPLSPPGVAPCRRQSRPADFLRGPAENWLPDGNRAMGEVRRPPNA